MVLIELETTTRNQAAFSQSIIHKVLITRQDSDGLYLAPARNHPPTFSHNYRGEANMPA